MLSAQSDSSQIPCSILANRDSTTQDQLSMHMKGRGRILPWILACGSYLRKSTKIRRVDATFCVRSEPGNIVRRLDNALNGGTTVRGTDRLRNSTFGESTGLSIDKIVSKYP